MIMLNVVFEAFVCIINKQKKRKRRRRKIRNRRHLYKCNDHKKQCLSIECKLFNYKIIHCSCNQFNKKNS